MVIFSRSRLVLNVRNSCCDSKISFDELRLSGSSTFSSTGEFPQSALPKQLPAVGASTGEFPQSKLPAQSPAVGASTGEFPQSKLPKQSRLVGAASGEFPQLKLAGQSRAAGASTGEFPQSKAAASAKGRCLAGDSRAIECHLAISRKRASNLRIHSGFSVAPRVVTGESIHGRKSSVGH
jgi:hypothetical protein